MAKPSLSALSWTSMHSSAPLNSCTNCTALEYLTGVPWEGGLSGGALALLYLPP